jgi:hypothetical protein
VVGVPAEGRADAALGGADGGLAQRLSGRRLARSCRDAQAMRSPSRERRPPTGGSQARGERGPRRGFGLSLGVLRSGSALCKRRRNTSDFQGSASISGVFHVVNLVEK